MDFPTLKLTILDLAKKDPEIMVLWLYGSHAKNSAHENSDIDLAVVFKSWIEDPIERRLRSELLAIEWQKELKLNDGMLSVLDMNNAPIPIAMSVLKTGTLLLSKDRGQQLREQSRIMSKWEIDYLYHYQHQKAIYG